MFLKTNNFPCLPIMLVIHSYTNVCGTRIVTRRDIGEYDMVLLGIQKSRSAISHFESPLRTNLPAIFYSSIPIISSTLTEKSTADSLTR